MKFPTFNHTPDDFNKVILTLTIIAVIGAAIKFLLNGVQCTLSGHVLNFGTTDSMSYASFLGPILGAHGYLNRNQGGGGPDETKAT